MRITLDGHAMDARPFLKWAGGKSQLIDTLLSFTPPTIKTYYEPFLGGGAMFFALYRKGRIKSAVLGDLNEDLVFLYRLIRDAPEDVINALMSGEYENTPECYYRIRNEFNEMRRKGIKNAIRAAHMIYLNRTCYNGLWRVNSRGDFNVPFGRYARLSLPTKGLILSVSKALKIAKIYYGDFETTVKNARKGDFVYMDPPYMPVSKTASFTAYTENCFTWDDQKRLASVVHELSKRGVYVMLSNSDTEPIHNLYREYMIIRVRAARYISSNPNTRSGITELVILNYEP